MVIVKWIFTVLGLLLIAGLLFVTFGLYRLSRKQPNTEEMVLGVKEGMLRPCPRTPNCVSTQADPADAEHYVEPIPLFESKETVLDRLADYIEDLPRAQVVEREDGYLHAVFASRLFGFMDDVELYVPEGEGVVHFRSASRVGVGDMGVNRGRYQMLRQVLEENTP